MIAMKQSSGPQLCFARLRPDPSRTQKQVDEIGGRWAALLKTGGLSETTYAIDDTTILISVTDGKDLVEVKDFVLSRDEADEFEWNQQRFRREGEAIPLRPDPAAAAKPTKAKKAAKKKKKAKPAKVTVDKEDL